MPPHRKNHQTWKSLACVFPGLLGKVESKARAPTGSLFWEVTPRDKVWKKEDRKSLPSCPGCVTKLVTFVSNGGLILLGALEGAKALEARESEEGLTPWLQPPTSQGWPCLHGQATAHRQQRNTETKARCPCAVRGGCRQVTSARLSALATAGAHTWANRMQSGA